MPSLRRMVPGSATILTQMNVPGLTYAPGEQLVIRMQVAGSSPTTLRAKVWKDGGAEPAACQVTATDTTASPPQSTRCRQRSRARATSETTGTTNARRAPGTDSNQLTAPGTSPSRPVCCSARPRGDCR